MKLDELVTQLRDAYGTDLRAVLLYGSAVAGEHFKKRSDYNVAVIIDTFSLDRIREASAVARAWRDDGNPTPMTFTTHEWRTSADVFPMEYADILERHQVLYGEAPFDGITVTRADLRLQTEREALGIVLRLRQATLLAGADAGEQLKLLTGSLSSLMIVFRAVVRLHGGVPVQNYADLVKEVAERVGFDPAPFYAVVHHARDAQPIDKDRTGAVLAGYLRGMEAVAEHADGLA